MSQSTERQTPPDELTGEQRAASAQQIYDTLKLLWDDQVELAASLRDRRKLYATIVGATGALGVLRIGWTARPDEVSQFVSPAAEWAARGCVVLALFCLAWACVMVFREDSSRAGASTKTEEQVVVVSRAFDPSALPAAGADRNADEQEVENERALAATDLSDQEVERLAEMAPHDVYLERALALRRAYLRLVKRNAVMRGRLRRGLLGLGAGYALLATAVVLYTLFAGPRSATPHEHSQPPTPAVPHRAAASEDARGAVC